VMEVLSHFGKAVPSRSGRVHLRVCAIQIQIHFGVNQDVSGFQTSHLMIAS